MRLPRDPQTLPRPRRAPFSNLCYARRRSRAHDTTVSRRRAHAAARRRLGPTHLALVKNGGARPKPVVAALARRPREPPVRCRRPSRHPQEGTDGRSARHSGRAGEGWRGRTAEGEGRRETGQVAGETSKHKMEEQCS